MVYYMKEMMELIKEFVFILSLFGNIVKIINFIENYVSEWNVEMKCNNKGVFILMVKGKNDVQYCLLMVYVDMLGVMVKEIKFDGCLSFFMIGGFCWNFVEGEYCEIEILSGKIYIGMILMY